VRAKLLAIGLLTSSSSLAQLPDSTAFDDRFEVRVGGQVFTEFTTRLRIDSESLGLGTEIDLEEDLDVEERISIARLDGLFRINRRHSLAMSLYDISREGVRTTTREINYGDAVFPVGTPVISEFEQKIIKLAYRFRFVSKSRAELSGSFGLHTMQLRSALRAVDGSIAQTRDADAPLPVIGVQGSYRFADRWRFSGSVEWFDIQSGDLQGTFTDFVVAVEHDTTERFGFGVGFNRLGLRFEAGDENLSGRLDVGFAAALIYFRGRFGTVD
jgi:hypothetical protein